MQDEIFKFPTLNKVAMWHSSPDPGQLREDMAAARNAPVYLNGQLAEITKLIPPPFEALTFEENFSVDVPMGKCGFIFEDDHVEYAVIKQINVFTGAEPRIDIITEGPLEQAPFE